MGWTLPQRLASTARCSLNPMEFVNVELARIEGDDATLCTLRLNDAVLQLPMT